MFYLRNILSTGSNLGHELYSASPEGQRKQLLEFRYLQAPTCQPRKSALGIEPYPPAWLADEILHVYILRFQNSWHNRKRARWLTGLVGQVMIPSFGHHSLYINPLCGSRDYRELFTSVSLTWIPWLLLQPFRTALDFHKHSFSTYAVTLLLSKCPWQDTLENSHALIKEVI